MVTRFALALCATGFMSMAAYAASPASEVGYPTGSLAVHSITSGAFTDAERTLAPVSREDARDPARLINIGLVYARTGRLAEAQAAFAAAKTAPDAVLTLADGREASSRAMAASLLRSVGASYAAR